MLTKGENGNRLKYEVKGKLIVLLSKSHMDQLHTETVGWSEKKGRQLFN